MVRVFIADALGSVIAERCADRMEEALGQIRTAAEYKGEKIAVLEARKQLCWYLRGISHAGYYKQEIVKMVTLADAERIVRGVQRDLR